MWHRGEARSTCYCSGKNPSPSVPTTARVTPTRTNPDTKRQHGIASLQLVLPDCKGAVSHPSFLCITCTLEDKLQQGWGDVVRHMSVSYSIRLRFCHSSLALSAYGSVCPGLTERHNGNGLGQSHIASMWCYGVLHQLVLLAM